ncbi:MAG: sugar ABC transporter permease, partial [Clostridiales bacterium]|nr:sugar ABC transporter permease [Clostridiales bacterium]
VIIVGIMIIMLNPTDGVVNLLLKLLGGKGVAFLQDSRWFRTVYILMVVWQGTGFGAIVYLAAIVGVDPQLYEAAIIDGASRLQRIWHITIRGILPTIVIMLILRLGSALNLGWYEVLLLQNDLNADVSEIIQTFVYKRGIVESNYSYATAVGLMMSVISLMLIVVSNWVARRSTDGDIYLF